MVHDKVLDYICWNNSILTRYQTCVYYNGENALGGFGFCDLYNMSTGEVWELKKQSCSYSCWTSTATHQLEGYIKGKLKHRPDLTLQKPYCTDIIGGHFSFTKNEYIYEVDYWNEGNGILRYSYWRRPTERRMTATLVVAGIVVVGLILCAPAGVGAGVLAFA